MASVIYLNYDREKAKLFAEGIKGLGLADVDYASSLRELFDKLREKKFNIIIIRMSPSLASTIADGIKLPALLFPADFSNEEKREVIRFVVKRMTEPGMTKVLKNSPILKKLYRELKEKEENT